MAFSPDGRFLAFDLPLEDSEAADVFTLAVDGSGEKTIVGHGSDDELVAWSPDGGHLLSERSRRPEGSVERRCPQRRRRRAAPVGERWN